MGDDSDIEILPRMEIIYEDMKVVTGVEPKFKLGQTYEMIKDQTIPDAGLEDISLHVNIRKYAIKKVATCPKLFPCAEVISWILPQEDAATMIMSNKEG